MAVDDRRGSVLDPLYTAPGALPSRDEARLPWIGVATVLLAVLLGAGAAVAGLEEGPKPPFLDPATRADPDATSPRRADGVLRLAGSGSNLPLTRKLASAFARSGKPRPVVHPSVGSGGGIRALLDGVIDVALVSRPLQPRERDNGLVEVPYARVPVVVAVNEEVPDESIAADELLAIYAGERRLWSDGSRIVVLQREQGDSSHRAVAEVLPEFERINEEAYRERRWRVLYHDAAMRDALASTEGALGLHGSGTIRPTQPFRPLKVDGVQPNHENLSIGAYPFYKDLSFVTRGEPSGAAADLAAFARSPEGQAVIREAGALPLGGDGD